MVRKTAANGQNRQYLSSQYFKSGLRSNCFFYYIFQYFRQKFSVSQEIKRIDQPICWLSASSTCLNFEPLSLFVITVNLKVRLWKASTMHSSSSHKVQLRNQQSFVLIWTLTTCIFQLFFTAHCVARDMHTICQCSTLLQYATTDKRTIISIQN